MKNLKFIIITVILITGIVFAVKSSLAAYGTDDMVTVKGSFTNVTRPNITLKAEDGNDYLIHLGPIWYWEDNNYSLTLNSNVEIYGKLEPGKKEIYAYSIIVDGKTIKLVDDSGNPLWWNDGKGKNRGNGWGMGYERGGRCIRRNK